MNTCPEQARSLGMYFRTREHGSQKLMGWPDRLSLEQVVCSYLRESSCAVAFVGREFLSRTHIGRYALCRLCVVPWV